jgi:hypothetical protein
MTGVAAELGASGKSVANLGVRLAVTAILGADLGALGQCGPGARARSDDRSALDVVSGSFRTYAVVLGIAGDLGIHGRRPTLRMIVRIDHAAPR